MRIRLLKKSDASRAVSTTSAIALVILSFIIGVGFTIIYNNVQAISSSQSATSTETTPPVSVAASINQKPTVMAVKVDWCNTDNTGQDRFCPDVIDVVQGDIVQLMFIENDTDAHTFTLSSGPYSFQINETITGSADFLNNEALFNGSCVNSGYAQISAAISTVYCVSGSSLLSPTFLASNGASNFTQEQNANPGLPLTPGNSTNPHPIVVPISDETYYIDSPNLSGVSIPANATSSEVWGIGAFQASYAGVYEYTCVYHVSNGMFGYLVVLPNAYCDTNPSSCGLSSS